MRKYNNHNWETVLSYFSYHLYYFLPQCKYQWNFYQILVLLRNLTKQPENKETSDLSEKRKNITCISVQWLTETNWPCEFEDQRRSWTSWDQSACIWTQRPPSSIKSRSVHKSEERTKGGKEIKLIHSFSDEQKWSLWCIVMTRQI